jgi:hypothetical protein
VGILVALGTVAAAVAAAFAYLRGPSRPPRSAAAQAELDKAVADVDRELAADLEVMSMFDQTRQAFVLENGQFLRHRAVIEREMPAAYSSASSLYERIPLTETAMERRGPAGTMRDDDLATIHEWEGDARALQRALRAEATAAPPLRWEALRSRLPETLRRLLDRSTPAM